MDNFQATSKLSLIENQRKQQQQQQQPSSLASNLKRNKILIKTFFSLIILLAFITGAMIINLIHGHNKSQEKLKLDQQTESLRGFCSVTRFPDHCLNSVILLPDNSPDDIFIASLDLAIERVVNFTVLTRALILQSSSDAATESRNESALFRCSSLIDDSLNQLNRSLTASGESSLFGLRVDSGEMEELVREKIKEVSSRVNQAANGLRRCFAILGEDNSTAVIELRSGVYDGIMHGVDPADYSPSSTTCWQ
nr:pectinesterase 1-like [Coffea arabica]